MTRASSSHVREANEKLGNSFVSGRFCVSVSTARDNDRTRAIVALNDLTDCETAIDSSNFPASAVISAIVRSISIICLFNRYLTTNEQNE